MENDRADRPEQVRLPGFDEHAEHGQLACTYHRDSGVLRSRRASTWTAAALIAGVAATTGYLAHAIPGTGGTTTGQGTARPAGKSTVAKPGAPAVIAPVATSGGSGGAAGAGGGGDN